MNKALLLLVPILLFFVRIAPAETLISVKNLPGGLGDELRASAYRHPAAEASASITSKSSGTFHLSREISADLSMHESIVIHVGLGSPTTGTLTLKSGKGNYSRSLRFTAGEQHLVLPLSTFKRNGQSSGWQVVRHLELKTGALSGSAGFHLFSITALKKGEQTKLKPSTLYLHQKFNSVQDQEQFWPVYSIHYQEEGYKRRAAKRYAFIANYLKKWSGSKLKLSQSKDIDPNVANAIVIGADLCRQVGISASGKKRSLGMTGYSVSAQKGIVAVSSRTYHGCIYGMYAFLEAQGFHFYSARDMVFPSNAKPYFRTLELTDRPAMDIMAIKTDYALRGWTYDMMGDVKLACQKESLVEEGKSLWLDHTAGYLLPISMYRKGNPDYYAQDSRGNCLVTEKTPAMRAMLCLTHPEVLKITSDRLLKWMGDQPERWVFPVTQGDSGQWCKCETCVKTGNPADQMLVWLRHMGREVEKKFPDNFILSFAYAGSDIPPTNRDITLPDNVNIQYAPWPNANNAPNSLRDFEAEENIIAKSRLDAWLGVLPDNMGLYDYNGMNRFSMYGMADRVKWAARRGMRSIWYCGTPKIFREMFNYIHSRLNWNPYLDTSDLTRSFIEGYYRGAAAEVAKLVDTIYGEAHSGKYDKDMFLGGYLPRQYYRQDFFTDVMKQFDTCIGLLEKRKRAKASLVNSRNAFLRAAIGRLSPYKDKLSDDQYRVFGSCLDRFFSDIWLPEFKGLKQAGKTKKAQKKLVKLKNWIWDITYLDIGEPSLDKPITAVLQKLIDETKVVLVEERRLDFVKRKHGTTIIPPEQFDGGRYWREYQAKKDESEVFYPAISIYGKRTEYPMCSASFTLDETQAGKEHVMEFLGLDSDKAWCPMTPIVIKFNGQRVFDGPNGFKKDDWSKRRIAIPASLVKKGINTLSIHNGTTSDSLSSHWFMFSNIHLMLNRPRVTQQ